MQEIALFHGTRDYFLPSIMKEGLGANSAITEANIPSFLSDGLNAIGTRFKFDWKAGIEKFPSVILETPELFFIVKTAMQSRTGQFNFHHSALYLCDTERVARGYASNIPEIVSFGFALHDLLKKNSMHETIVEHPFVRTILPQRKAIEDSVPVVIKVTNFDLAKLFAEHGDPITKLCAPVDFRPKSYEYKSVIPASSLSVV